MLPSSTLICWNICFTSVYQFFSSPVLSLIKVWCSATSDERAQHALLTDVHSPEKVRSVDQVTEGNHIWENRLFKLEEETC